MQVFGLLAVWFLHRYILGEDAYVYMYFIYRIYVCIPHKTNIAPGAPEKWWLEDYCPLEMSPFSGDMLGSGVHIYIYAHISTYVVFLFHMAGLKWHDKFPSDSGDPMSVLVRRSVVDSFSPMIILCDFSWYFENAIVIKDHGYVVYILCSI